MTRPRRYPARNRTLASSSLVRAGPRLEPPSPARRTTARVHANCARTSGIPQP